MSKSKGNTVSPDEFIDTYGADTFRCYLMFMGPFDEGGDWNDKGIKGIYRFLNKSYNLILKVSNDDISNKSHYIFNATIKKVTEDLHNMKFNTALSSLMEFVNYFQKNNINNDMKNTFVQLLSPFAPHITEEMWEVLDHK